jgi:hypothetical protein
VILNSWPVAALFLVVCALVGMAIGLLTGLLGSLALKINICGIAKDGWLGLIGFLVGYIGASLMPWHQNTITYHLGNTLVTSTMDTYQHPGRIAVVFAIALPVLHTVHRFKHQSSSMVEEIPNSRIDGCKNRRP